MDNADTFSVGRNSENQTPGQTIGHGQDMYIPAEFENSVKDEDTITKDKLEKDQKGK